MRRRWIPLAVILTVPSGCDNVAWGGVDVRLEGPSAPPAVYASDLPSAADSVPLPELPGGPVLLAGTRSGDFARLTVVGTVGESGLDPFPSDDDVPRFREHFANTLLAPGTELVLFAEGGRVGRMTVTGHGTDDEPCVPRPFADGIVELLPRASSVERLLAMRDTGEVERAFGEYRAPEGFDRGAATSALGSAAIQASGAPWPPSLTGARADMQAFDLQGGSFVAATFMFGDELAVVEPTDPNAYSLFIVGGRDQDRWTTEYVGYRRADGANGKGAPRYFGHLDWNGDGTAEILLEVFGSRARWFAALGLEDGRWAETFQDPCGLRPAG